MYVIGGAADDYEVPPSVQIFDTLQGTWSEGARIPGHTFRSALCVVGTDIYAFGGEDAMAEERDSVFKYDTVADEWSTLAPMPFADAYASLSASVVNDVIYLVGCGDDGRGVLRFDPRWHRGVWSTLASTTAGHGYGASFVLGESLYVAGGGIQQTSVERYDMASDTWTAVAAMQKGRSHHRARQRRRTYSTPLSRRLRTEIEIEHLEAPE
jgi:N-acetylneuraminic acid mutarotase